MNLKKLLLISFGLTDRLAATATFELAPKKAGPGAIYIKEGEAEPEPFAPPNWHRSSPTRR